ncbi:hypothetical protein CEXT_307131 [Caerostris extrusa]|uniref:Uncharacterized protein n=1 Tax=Caerostris extrusa TaxID=172846 RepID=A0AAV4UVB9_CAEEX|nr:hypothetical protein CEXT_307131 [Caerostris extrusa]
MKSLARFRNRIQYPSSTSNRNILFFEKKQSCSAQNVFQVSFQPSWKEEGRSSVLRGLISEGTFFPFSAIVLSFTRFTAITLA